MLGFLALLLKEASASLFRKMSYNFENRFNAYLVTLSLNHSSLRALETAFVAFDGSAGAAIPRRFDLAALLG